MRRLCAMFLAVVALTVACGGDGEDEPGSAAQSPAAATATQAMQPAGELRIATNSVIGILDPAGKLSEGYSLIRYGTAETLTALSRANAVEPWLAESVASVDPNTWRVTLRHNARFHDGSPVTAADVATSLKRSWEVAPGADGILSKQTVVTVVDATTLDLTPPAPMPGLPNALASYHFAVHKPLAGGFALTGIYRPVRFEADNLLVLEAFADHWGGPPPIARVTFRRVPDANALALGLQAGDVDLAIGLPPEIVAGLPSEIERAIIPSSRVYYLALNHARPPFDERAVREAVALGVDRALLNKAAFDGLGAPISNVFPPNMGIDVVPAQSSDPARARQLLDQAGWRAGSDGIRVKDGRRLNLALFSYGGRPVDKTLAIALQAQLKELGVDSQFQERQDLFSTVTGGGDWDAIVTSFGVLPTGDPLYIFAATLTRTAPYNWGTYANPRLDAVIDQLRVEPDAGRRGALVREAQEAVKADAPNAYLLAAPLVTAYRRDRVKSFTPHPNDLYLIDRSVSVR